MSKILKILTGSQEGAELLVKEGQTLRIGSADACDVIVVDAMMPEQALELIADADGIIAKALSPQIFAGKELMKAGIQTSLPNYTVFTCGSVRLTVGDDGKPWPPLSWPPLEQLLEKREKTAQEEAQEKQRIAEEEQQRQEEQQAEERRRLELQRKEELKARRIQRRHRIIGVICWTALILCCLLGAALAAKKAWEIAEPPKVNAQDAVDLSIQKVKLSNLEALVEKYGLKLSDMDVREGRKLTGNLPNAAIRLHIQQLLKNKYFGITHELTDDETLAEAVRELLWGATNGCVRLVSLKDRNAVVSGMTASQQEWERICANIKADIPRLNRLEAKVVYADLMAAKLVKAFDQAGFKIRTEIFPLEIHLLGKVTENRQKPFEAMLAEAAKFFPPEARLKNLVKWVPETIPQEEPQQPASPVVLKPTQPQKPEKLPIASILMHPVPCIVMADGSRYATGAVIGDLTITQITLDSVTVTKDRKEYTFKP